jgi:nucleotide-binding universal stress UspA family protein
VIVATDGHDQSNSAMLLGRLLASESDALRVVTVLKRLPSVTPEIPLPRSPDVDASRRAEQKRMVRHQAARVWGEELVDVELCEGDPATTVARLARTTNATMIVAGLGRHRVAMPDVRRRNGARLIRVSSVPVFAVASGLTHAPQRVVVAVDFSETSSARAARARGCVAKATVYLAHVGPRDSLLHEWNGWGLSYKDDAGDALQKMREQLHVPSGMTVQRVMLQGEPATELLAFATSVNADMIATGSHGHGFVARMLVGSVTTRIIRCSTCSVLCVPHAAAMTRAGITIAPSVVKVLDRPEWSAKLNEFTNPPSAAAERLKWMTSVSVLSQGDHPLLARTIS